MKKSMMVAIAAVACTLCANTAMAQEVYVTITENGGVVASWDQSATPTPLAYNAGSDTDVAIVNATGGMAGYTDVDWFSVAGGGGIDTGLYNIFGSQQYSGSEAAPVFAPGVWSGLNDDGAAGGIPATITIATAGAVPEPASWAMMLAGFGMIGFVARRRHAVSVRYA